MSTITESASFVRAFIEAEDIAQRAAQRLSSAHLLLGLFTFPNPAQTLLHERRLDEDRVLSQLNLLEDEPHRTMPRLRERAREIAEGAGSKEIDCLHILIAMTRLRDAYAYKLLERTGTSLTSLRNDTNGRHCVFAMAARFRTLPLRAIDVNVH